MNRIGVLKESLDIISAGKYVVENKVVSLTHSASRLKKAVYLSENEVLNIIAEQKRTPYKRDNETDALIKVTNRDTFSAALAMNRMNSHIHDSEIMVLNFANPVNP